MMWEEEKDSELVSAVGHRWLDSALVDSGLRSALCEGEISALFFSNTVLIHFALEPLVSIKHQHISQPIRFCFICSGDLKINEKQRALLQTRR